ncbi:MAG TPA: hypothetical protein PLG50_01470 [bacterium]|nr:hypothetical protein [bacterium]
MKTNLVGMNRSDLEAYAQSIGEKPFRGRQLFSWIYAKGKADFAEMSDLAKATRLKLASGGAGLDDPGAKGGLIGEQFGQISLPPRRRRPD